MHDVIVINTFSYFSAKEILHLTTICKSWNSASSLDVIWLPLLERLWKDKVYIPGFSKILLIKSAKLAYFSSLIDSKRTFITKEELTSIIWSYRFKKEAGEDWLDQCPWSHGKEASQSKFHSDYVLERLKYLDSGDKDYHTPYQNIRLNWKIKMKDENYYHQTNVKAFYSMLEKCGFDMTINDGELSSSSISWNLQGGNPYQGIQMKSFSSNDEQTRSFRSEMVSMISNHSSCSSSTSSNDTNSTSSNHNESTDKNIPIRFKLPHEQLNPIGEQLILFVNGMQVPMYHLSRSPTGNWGFLFQSCWAMYTSWPMPKKGECLLLEENLDVTVESQWLEVRLYTERMQALLQANGIQTPIVVTTIATTAASDEDVTMQIVDDDDDDDNNDDDDEQS